VATWCRVMHVNVTAAFALTQVLLPALNRARDASSAVVCMSNLRQIHTSCVAYQAENQGFWPPAHYFYTSQNLHRWHGTRPTTHDPFDFTFSPLKPYLRTTRIKRCPSFEPDAIGFETAAGGYGYNDYYIGSSTGNPPPGIVGLAAYGLLGQLIVATVGAVLLLALLRFVKRKA